MSDVTGSAPATDTPAIGNPAIGTPAIDTPAIGTPVTDAKLTPLLSGFTMLGAAGGACDGDSCSF
jgi:hypothetical protein